MGFGPSELGPLSSLRTCMRMEATFHISNFHWRRRILEDGGADDVGSTRSSITFRSELGVKFPRLTKCKSLFLTSVVGT